MSRSRRTQKRKQDCGDLAALGQESPVWRDLCHPSMLLAVGAARDMGAGWCHLVTKNIAEALQAFETEAKWRCVLGEAGPQRVPHSWLEADEWTLDLSPSYDGSAAAAYTRAIGHILRPKLRLRPYRYSKLDNIPPLPDDQQLPIKMKRKLRKWLLNAVISTIENEGYID